MLKYHAIENRWLFESRLQYKLVAEILPVGHSTSQLSYMVQYAISDHY